jgi:hypothetical protein
MYRGAMKTRHWIPSSQNGHVERERERRKTYRNNLSELLECTPLGLIGRSNPERIEWLMGYPIGWTESDASETQ